MNLGYDHVPYAVLQRQMSGILFLLCCHCSHKHPLVTKASWLAFGIRGPRAQPCCLKYLERQPKGTGVCVLGPWLPKSLKPRGNISKFNWYFGSLVKYLSNLCCTVWVGKKIGFVFQVSENSTAILRTNERNSQLVWCSEFWGPFLLATVTKGFKILPICLELCCDT